MLIGRQAKEDKIAKVTVTTDHGDAVRKNALLAEFEGAADKGDWASKVPIEQQPRLIEALFLKVNELDKRLRALEEK